MYDTKIIDNIKYYYPIRQIASPFMVYKENNYFYCTECDKKWKKLYIALNHNCKANICSIQSKIKKAKKLDNITPEKACKLLIYDTIKELIEEYCTAFEIDNKDKPIEISKEFIKSRCGMHITPRLVASACIYIAFRNTENSISQKRLSEHISMSESSLRKYIKQIEMYL